MKERQEKTLQRFGIGEEELIEIEGRYWLTSETIGKCLGFNNPRRSISNLYNRHREELDPYKGVINLVTTSSKDGRGGGLQEMTVFNTDGMWIIAMLSKGWKAKKFRQLVVGILKAVERQEFIHVRPPTLLDLCRETIQKYERIERQYDLEVLPGGRARVSCKGVRDD